MRHAARSTTSDQPTPMSRRFPPVMLASASGAYLSGSWPALTANVKSTAYSGRTAISARTAIARPCETSSCSTSAPHARRKAAPTTANPNKVAANHVGGEPPVARKASAGSVAAAASRSGIS